MDCPLNRRHTLPVDCCCALTAGSLTPTNNDKTVVIVTVRWLSPPTALSHPVRMRVSASSSSIASARQRRHEVDALEPADCHGAGRVNKRTQGHKLTKNLFRFAVVTTRLGTFRKKSKNDHTGLRVDHTALHSLLERHVFVHSSHTRLAAWFGVLQDAPRSCACSVTAPHRRQVQVTIISGIPFRR